MPPDGLKSPRPNRVGRPPRSAVHNTGSTLLSNVEMSDLKAVDIAF